MRYDGKEYFWADNYNGVNIVFLGKDSEGKNRLNLTDAKGQKIIQSFLEKNKEVSLIIGSQEQDQKKHFLNEALQKLLILTSG